MASKTEIERMAAHIWNRVAKPTCVAEKLANGDHVFSVLETHQQRVWRTVARWHLRKVKEAYDQGLDDVVGSGDYD